MDERSGRVSSPFGDDDDSDEKADEDVNVDVVTDEVVEHEPEPSRAEATTPPPADEDIPYVLRRTSVKDERVEKSFPLRDETLATEQDVHREVETLVGADVYGSDLREAAFLVGLRHADEVADVLLEWGYEYR